MEYQSLKKRHPAFVYEDYEVHIGEHTINLKFHYTLEGEDPIRFVHRLEYKYSEEFKMDGSEDLFDNFAFHIGCVEMINYYKLTCAPKIVIRCGQLDQDQIKWWKKLFYHGLGEFIYLNKMVDQVREDNFFAIECQTDKPFKNKPQPFKTFGNLIPIGGGKDSVVTLEVLRGQASHNLPFYMSAPQAAFDCGQIAGYGDGLVANRYFDKTMLKMNDAGYLNGHIPFSAVLAMIASLGALLTGKRYIPLSNERSANEPSVPGTTFNHQYSKSFEFEKDFSDYLHKYLTPDIHYFSLLRPLYEIQIAQMFANYASYHQKFRSCNRGKSTNTWCGECPKCLFVFIILSPYVPFDQLVADFGKNLYEDMSLSVIFEELIGLRPTKPFECIGTVWEVRHALDLFLEKEPAMSSYALLQHYMTMDGPSLAHEPTDYEDGHLVPEEYLNLLRGEMDRLDIQGYAH